MADTSTTRGWGHRARDRTYNDILRIDPTDTEGAKALDRLYGRAELVRLALDARQEVELSGTTAETVVLKYRIGKLFGNAPQRYGSLGRVVSQGA